MLAMAILALIPPRSVSEMVKGKTIVRNNSAFGVGDISQSRGRKNALLVELSLLMD